MEKFLDKCLESVEKQTFNDFEVIIVNDGSPDNSQAVIDKFTERNDNFISYTIENSGQGGARNFGLEKASGDFIAFLDSDDYIAPECLERLYETAQYENSDIVVCSCYDVKEDGTIISKMDNNLKNATTSLQDSPQILFNRVAPWGKLFKKSVFQDLRFATRVWYEDLRLIPKLYLNANKISYIDEPLFYYVQREGSTMNNTNAKKNLEIIDAFEDLISYYKEKNQYNAFKSEFEYLLMEHIAVAAITRVALCSGNDKKEVLAKIEEYLSTFDNLYNNKYYSCLDTNKKLILAFNKRKLYFLTALCMKLKNLLSK
ncbi:MAG: glycosyltransferase family 2 protein [Clostridia bacterium]|nr:glycosyltransferase family 2 protein [Clostridia bacterium]